MSDERCPMCGFDYMGSETKAHCSVSCDSDFYEMLRSGNKSSIKEYKSILAEEDSNESQER